MKKKLLLIMSLGIISLGLMAQKPKGELTYCSYCCSGAAGLGTDYCKLIADVAGEEKVVVVLNDGNRFGDPVINFSYPVDRTVVDSLGRMLMQEKVYKLNGYNMNEAICGGHSYSFNMEYSSGDKVSVYWYGHNVKERAIAAYHMIERFFSPWREQAVKDGKIQQKVERIKAMEERYDRLLKAVKKRKSYPGLHEDVHALMYYAESKQWQEDFEADERGEIPKDLKRGVLSEDGLDNLLRSKTLFRLRSQE